MQRHVPYGYVMHKGKIYISVIEAYRVKLIFHLYLTGKSQKKICEIFTKARMKTPNNKDRWNHATIRSILMNKKYIGDAYHCQIIDEQAFEDALNKRKKINDSVSAKMKFKRMRSNCFSGKLICSKCGEIFIRKKERPGGKPKILWRCKNYIKDNKVSCQRSFIEENQLENLFVEAINEIIKNPNLLLTEPDFDTTKTNFEVNRLTVSINRMIEDETIEDIEELLLKRAIEIYKISKIDDYYFKTNKVIDAINDAVDVDGFSEELFDKVIKNVIVDVNGCLTFIFINRAKLNLNPIGKKIAKELIICQKQK